MAARLTDKQKKKIIADYVEMGSYNAVAKRHKISATTVKKLVLKDTDSVKKCELKKKQNTADILAHMESKKTMVNQIMDVYLKALLDHEKVEKATPQQLTTALGTLIDKWTSIGGGQIDLGKEDGLSQSLKEIAEKLENDD